MTPLCNLAFKYGSDKCPQIKHHYTEFYFDLLKDRRKTIKKVVEIGVGTTATMNHYPNYQDGASLYMWRDFFPHAQIYGADILPQLVFQDERIQTFCCNQTVKSDLRHLIAHTGPDIDLFIDDGSHLPHDQIFTCLAVMPKLSHDVTYIIEDVVQPEIINWLADYDCLMPRFKHKSSWDDRLIIVRHSHG